jgi:hypothetical protein
MEHGSLEVAMAMTMVMWVYHHRYMNDKYAMEGTSGHVERGVGLRQGAVGTLRHELPTFGSRNGGETLRTAIIHYKDNKCVITMR